MLNESTIYKLNEYLNNNGFIFYEKILRGDLYVCKEDNEAIIIDRDICNSIHPFNYSQYTKEQNSLMYKYDFIYRFVIDDEDDFTNLKEEYERLKNSILDEEEIKNSGVNRTLLEIDPTVPEAYFEQGFIDVFGNESLESVLREEPIIDMNSQTRYIDYLVCTKKGKIAIEENGEVYHHPILIGKERYQRQLTKQNSIVQNNIKVYRWSIEGMKVKDNFYDELKLFIGTKENLTQAQKLSVTRKIKLFKHQEITIKTIDNEREKGEKTFLIVLPTGTGKTEIYIADFIKELNKDKITKILVVVPQTKLRDDTIKKIRKRLIENELEVTVGNDFENMISVVTNSYISRHYYYLDKKAFDYIVIDEAHHVVAPTMIKVVQHFNPNTLIGLTATDKRLDEKKLEDIFGKYEETMSLEEAIKSNLLSPIKAYRIESNIDLSQVRFNGKEYVSTDLQRTLIVPSRDKLIVDTLKKYFHPTINNYKSGIIFCVSISHSEKMAKLMKENGFSCESVSSKNLNSDTCIDNYQDGKIQFLTTCSLLNEGWDSPRTSIIVMARPTLSKVLYTQQLGRGTRKMEGKEALYVFDVVDNYGYYGNISNSPWSLHALFGLNLYKPFSDLFEPEKNISREELLLDTIYEQERKLEPINIFTFEKQYGDYLSDEKLARELFVSTDTVKNWVKNKKITPCVILKVGTTDVNFYSPEVISEIRNKMNLKLHNEETIYDDFFEFINDKNYSLSYKMILMLSVTKAMDVNGECNFDELIEEYCVFYKHRLHNNQVVDRKTCPFNVEYINDKTKMKYNLLINPFEKFERKRFMVHAKDLNYIMFSSSLWEKLNTNDLEKIKKKMFNDLIDYYNNLNDPIDADYWGKYWRIK